MIDYIIWLTSGESLHGTMEETEAGRLKQIYQVERTGRYTFRDTDGTFMLSLSKVAAIAFNETSEESIIGFK